jgi:RNA polymerase sigma factor (sigma-70 family)
MGAAPAAGCLSSGNPPKALTEISAQELARLRVAAEFWARKFAGTTAGFDDLVQEGFQAAVTAVRAYRPGSAATVETFATTCIKNRMLDFVRREMRIARPLISGDAFVSDEGEQTLFDIMPAKGISVIDALCANEMSQRVVQVASNLPFRERYCIQGYFFRHSTHGALARELGISRTRVIQVIQAGLKELQSALRAPASSHHSIQ